MFLLLRFSYVPPKATNEKYEKTEEAPYPYPARYCFRENGRGYTISYEIYGKGFERAQWINNGGISRSFTIASSLDIQPLLPGPKTLLCTDLDSSMMFASQWLKQCNENHKDCQGNTENTFLPARLVDIDSLFICQDDTDDWLHESSRMADVYENSHCNISATAAKDGSVGCFFPRDEKLIAPLKIDASWTTLSAGAYYVIDDGLWVREVDNAPLNMRAWVFQERFLCPRNLSFGGNRMFWECQGLRASESFPGGLPKSMSSATFKVSNPAALRELYKPGPKKTQGTENVDAMKVWLLLITGAQMPVRKGSDFSDEKKEGVVLQAYRQWTHLISAYTAAKLTYDSDLLIALFGVANWMKRSLFKDTYLAGLWKDHIVNQLLWMTYKNLKKSYPEAYQAPSWSWASVNGKIAFRDILETDEKTTLA
ncbi:hypothetical protein G7Y89_g5007 [Cudoniella acicularis]|uniref:Heterokaryon incompatibility domain-containing protein n=1 Tax=Cudoniella acicularis TaxID=354080 RepID=A0A8H4RQI2_9HELO|nr:hypothetical protein G7Y89_g5007 [Cudoniella acicularis]